MTMFSSQNQAFKVNTSYDDTTPPFKVSTDGTVHFASSVSVRDLAVTGKVSVSALNVAATASVLALTLAGDASVNVTAVSVSTSTTHSRFARLFIGGTRFWVPIYTTVA